MAPIDGSLIWLRPSLSLFDVRPIQRLDRIGNLTPFSPKLEGMGQAGISPRIFVD